MACSSFVKGSNRCEGNMADVTHLDVTYQFTAEKKTCVPIMWTKLDHSEVNCSAAPDDLDSESETLDTETSTTLAPAADTETSATLAPEVEKIGTTLVPDETVTSPASDTEA